MTIPHTPTPWTLKPREDHDPNDPESHCCGIFGANGEEIVVTDSGYYPPRLADAYLIAAAPDMLAALKTTLEYWESTGFADCEEGCDCIVEHVRAAIAKAEGTA